MSVHQDRGPVECGFPDVYDDDECPELAPSDYWPDWTDETRWELGPQPGGDEPAVYEPSQEERDWLNAEQVRADDALSAEPIDWDQLYAILARHTEIEQLLARIVGPDPDGSDHNGSFVGHPA